MTEQELRAERFESEGQERECPVCHARWEGHGYYCSRKCLHAAGVAKCTCWRPRHQLTYGEQPQSRDDLVPCHKDACATVTLEGQERDVCEDHLRLYAQAWLEYAQAWLEGVARWTKTD